ncbi:Basic-leucine zipper (bZIP) transcription factor [Neofusicoccum parvum]|uniref:Basic-leucine zipper (BZIP) transcription factor n=1 Tax=Neofusicoccum parvum TaxID=310453 RepID=A0ACB5RXW7_9PEZI|nr:Basic-leucine zipper (bZIP) transcription factor [Neofusicoccum parvum]
MPTQEPNLSSEFMQECLRFQMQLLNKITPPEDSGFSGFFDEKDDMSPSSPSNARDPLHTNHAGAQHPAPPKTAPLDERIEYVLECAQTAGFDSFDALASAYYTGTFDDGSLLAAEQRLSRNRRLSKLLADVFDAARGWSAWERRGFHEEVLQSAEAMLVAECAGFARLLDGRGGGQGQGAGAAGRGEALLHDQAAVKRLFQNEMPNLGALMTALAAENTAVRHRDRPNAVMATVLVLCFTGRVSNSQLNTVLSSWLEGLGGGK